MHFIAPESAVKCQKESTSFSDVVILHRLSKDGAIFYAPNQSINPRRLPDGTIKEKLWHFRVLHQRRHQLHDCDEDGGVVRCVEEDVLRVNRKPIRSVTLRSGQNKFTILSFTILSFIETFGHFMQA